MLGHCVRYEVNMAISSVSWDVLDCRAEFRYCKAAPAACLLKGFTLG